MFALVFGVLFAVSFLGFAITSKIKYSAASHLFWGVAFIIFTVCFICAFCYTIGTSDLPMWVKFLLLKQKGKIKKKMKKKLRLILLVTLCLCLIGGVTGCAVLDDTINEIKGNLVGNGYTIRTYDNYGSKVMTTTGDKINIQGNPVETTSYSSDGSVVTGYEMSSVITINIDSKEIQSCGDTCIFEQDGLQPDVDFVQTDIYSQSTGKLSDNTYVAGIVNKYKNYFGKSRVVVIKSQLGQPIVAYSGDEVYWKIPKDLPKMTKLMIDGKALYIHRANFQIIDTALLGQERRNKNEIQNETL